jgi:predicted metal-dependent enzyme (double-stranded beta helix superfamily)
MYTLDNFLDELRSAASDSDLTAMANAVQNAIREKPSAQNLSSQMLHSEPGFTVLHVVVNPGFISPPHDHRTWAVIGVYDGQEDNSFYRLIDGSRRIDQVASRSLKRGEVVTLDSDAIHRIANPLSSKLIALHVYGRNIFDIQRSSWDPVTGDERPFTLALDSRGQARS